ncbi:MAG TPA: hypothetical protein VLE43_14090, partial [Candidatus Saccharimonadia bacterium]|nr:hypothetical protein [Candidatus Saccharimonadia bacterium]
TADTGLQPHEPLEEITLPIIHERSQGFEPLLGSLCPIPGPSGDDDGCDGDHDHQNEDDQQD